MSDLHRALREQLGAFALGHLDRAESAQLRAHLVTCLPCREELEAIAPLRRLLRGIDPDRVSRPLSSVAGKRGRPVAARRVRGRRLRTAGVATTAAAAVAAAGFLLGAGVRPGRTEPPGPAQEQVAVRRLIPNVEAKAGLVAHTWGTEVKLTAAGLAKGETYRVVLTGLDGQVVAAGSLVGTGEQELRCNLNAAVLRSAAASFKVVAADGTPVLTGDFDH